MGTTTSETHTKQATVMDTLTGHSDEHGAETDGVGGPPVTETTTNSDDDDN